VKMAIGGLCVLLFALTTRGHGLTSAPSCETLSSLALPNTSITLAQVVPAGSFALPGTGGATPHFSQVPTFCRVAATLTPSSDSDIKIEVWLPIADWNGKFEAVGNGGWAGTITHDGKLLIYHGWNDGGSGGAISPLNTIKYYESVLAKMGSSQQDLLRLFMVPGMAHCGGGPGPNQVNWMGALERWRESGIAPDRLIASRVGDNHENRTRPICSHPAVAN